MDKGRIVQLAHAARTSRTPGERLRPRVCRPPGSRPQAVVGAQGRRPGAPRRNRRRRAAAAGGHLRDALIGDDGAPHRPLPVVDAAGRAVGVITLADLVRLRRDARPHGCSRARVLWSGCCSSRCCCGWTRCGRFFAGRFPGSNAGRLRPRQLCRAVPRAFAPGRGGERLGRCCRRRARGLCHPAGRPRIPHDGRCARRDRPDLSAGRGAGDRGAADRLRRAADRHRAVSLRVAADHRKRGRRARRRAARGARSGRGHGSVALAAAVHRRIAAWPPR